MFEPGTYLGAYQLLEEIGQGAIGLVYLAEHSKLKRKVALKVLRDELASNPKAVARFFGEARAVNAIAHENIVEITDFVEGDEERRVPSHYIMELLEGRNLKEALEQDRLSIDEVLDIGAQIASGLAAVHEKQIVHRDLKPANIFLVTDDKRTDFVKLLDFGVAKLSTALNKGQPNTGSGMIVGTPGYMSPEQIQSIGIDHRADIYALGLVLFEMVTGQPPFVESDLLELLYQHCDQEPPHPDALYPGTDRLPPQLSQLILDCLKKDPAERPQSADEVRRRLITIKGRRRIRRRLVPASWVAAAAACTIALVGLGGESDHAPVILIEEVAAEPAGPSHVLMRFASDPPGAEVFLGDELLGHTPFAHAFAKDARSARFTFHLDGHQIEDEEVVFNADTHVKVSLKPTPAPVAAAPAPAIEPAPIAKAPKKKVPRKKLAAIISKAELRNPFE